MANTQPAPPKKEDYAYCKQCDVYVAKSKLVELDGFFDGPGDKVCPFCQEKIEA